MDLVRDVQERHELWIKASAWLSQLATTTQRTYLSIIREYCAFLGAPAGTRRAAEMVTAARTLHAEAYVLFLKQQKGEVPREVRISPRRGSIRGLNPRQSNATIAKKIMALRKCYEVLIAAELYHGPNPFSRHALPVPDPRGGRKRDTQMIPFDKVAKILSSVEDGPRAVRDRAVLSVLFGGGLRRSEVAKLMVGDIGISERGTTFLRLRDTKDGQDHLQALPEWAADAVLALRDEREAAGATIVDPLFVRWTGRGGLIPTEEPLGETAVYHLFKRACAACGLGPQYTPHSARATAITKLLDDGMPHREVQEFSRHSSIQMVEWYDKRRFGVDKSPAKGLSFGTGKKSAA